MFGRNWWERGVEAAAVEAVLVWARGAGCVGVGGVVVVVGSHAGWVGGDVSQAVVGGRCSSLLLLYTAQVRKWSSLRKTSRSKAAPVFCTRTDGSECVAFREASGEVEVSQSVALV